MKQKPKLTQADEQKSIEWEITMFRRRMFKKNRDLKYFQITGVDIVYSEVQMAPVALHWQFWKRWGRKPEQLKTTNHDTSKF